MQLANTFQTGLADETTMTVANSDDGGAGDTFDIVDIGAGNGLVYDTAFPLVPDATLSGRVDLGASSGTIAAASWNLPADETQIYGRLYFRLNDALPDSIRVIGWEDGGAGVGRINISSFTGGVIQVVNADFSQSDFASAVIPQDTNMRLEFCPPAGVEYHPVGDSSPPLALADLGPVRRGRRRRLEQIEEEEILAVLMGEL